MEGDITMSEYSLSALRVDAEGNVRAGSGAGVVPALSTRGVRGSDMPISAFTLPDGWRYELSAHP
jgi:hypothetical protein